MLLLFICFGSVDSVENAEHGGYVDVCVDTDTEDISSVGLSELDVGNRLRVGALRDSVLTVGDELVLVDAH